MTNVDRWSLAALGVILLFAIALRAPQLGESLWLDELHTAWVVDGGWREIPSRAAIGNQSPLYFMLPWAATRVLGLNEDALRLPSLVAGTALVIAVCALVWRMTSSRLGALLAAWLAAIDPNFLWFSCEARPYAWVQLVGVLQVFSFWQTLAQPTWKWRLALVALSTALFYLHYTAALLIVAEIIYFALAYVFFRGETRYSVAAAIGDLAIVACCCLPATAHLQAIANRREAWWKFVPREPSPAALVTLFPLCFVVGPPLAIVATCRFIRWWRSKKESQESFAAQLLLGLLWLCVPLLLAFGATWLQAAPLWHRRYMMVSAAAPIVISGVLCAPIGPRGVRIAAVLIVAIAATWSHGPQRQFFSDGRWVARNTPDWRTAIAEINRAEETAHWPVLVRSGLIEADRLNDADDEALRAYCLLPVSAIYRIDGDRQLLPLAYSLPARLSPAEAERLRGHGSFWLITPGHDKTKDAALQGVRRSTKHLGDVFVVEQAENFGGVWVVRIRMTNSQ